MPALITDPRTAPQHRTRACSRRVLLLAPAVGLAAATSVLAGPVVAAADDDAPFSITGHLADVPGQLLDGDSAMLTIANIDAALEAAGSEVQAARDPDRLDADTLLTWLGPITGIPLDRDASLPTFAPIFVPFPAALPVHYASLSEETAALTGWSIADVSSFAAVDVFPGAFAAVHGDFDDSTLHPDLVDVGGGIVSLGDAEDFATNIAAGPNALDQLGRAVRMAHRDGVIAASTSTPNVASWLAGPAPSAADHPAMAAIAAELDAAGAQSAVIGPMSPLDPALILGPGVDAAQADEVLASLTAQVLPATVTTVGIGWGAGDDGEAVITLVYFTLGDADEVATRLTALMQDGSSSASGQPFADLLVLDDVRTGDVTVTATLRPAEGRPPKTPMDMYVRRDLPFVAAG